MPWPMTMTTKPVQFVDGLFWLSNEEHHGVVHFIALANMASV